MFGAIDEPGRQAGIAPVLLADRRTDASALGKPDGGRLMARRTARDADCTKQTIKCAAVQVFCAAGVVGATLSEVARLAGVTRGAVYWHFESKEGLLETVCQDAADILVQALSRKMPSSTPLEAVAATAEAVFRTVAGEGDAQRSSALLFKWGRHGGSDIICSQRTELSIRLRAYAGGCIEEAVAARQIRGNTNIRTAALAYEAYVFGIVESWLS
ncbi:unnamed protein product, partial [marine sediment metagenome]